MTAISMTSVLHGLCALAGQTADGKKRVITVPALAKQTGKTAAEVKTILAENESALARNDAGKLVGVNLVAYARKRGLIVQSISRMSGARHYQTFREGEDVIGKFCLDYNEEWDAAHAFERKLKSEGKVICEKIRDLPVEVLSAVWNEQGAVVLKPFAHLTQADALLSDERTVGHNGRKG